MCNCISAINEKLAEHNGQIEINLLANPLRSLVATCKKKERDIRKPPKVEAAFCPFCGEKYATNKNELARRLV